MDDVPRDVGTARVLQHVLQGDVLVLRFWEAEVTHVQVLAEAEDVDTTPRLRHAIIGCVEHLMEDIVPGVLQCCLDHRERLAVVMPFQVPDILEEHHLWLSVSCDANYLVEERAACVGEATLQSGDAERLAWKAAAQHVMFWNVPCRDLRDVTDDALAPVRLVRPLGVPVNLGYEDALCVGDGLHRQVKAAYACEKVNELGILV